MIDFNKTDLGPISIPTIVFIVLKLTGIINWSWWWVLSPLWITAAVAALFLLAALVIRR